MTIEAHPISEGEWRVDSLMMDFASKRERYLYDGETGKFFKAKMPM